MRRILFAASLFGFALIQATAPVRADDVDRIAPWRGDMAAASAHPAQTAKRGHAAKTARLAVRDRAARSRQRVVAARGVSLAGVSGPLAAKARGISAACGSVVVSGVRHTRVAGTRRMSEHSRGRAVDMQGNPSCIYAQLRGWPGGYTTDYGRVRHVHISLGGNEDGLRFAHGGGRRAAARVKVSARSHAAPTRIRLARR